MRTSFPHPAPVLGRAIGIVLLAGLLALPSAAADGVYGSGLFELGDGQDPPGMPGMADITADPEQNGPDWAELFYADGSARDDYPYDLQGNPLGNGIPDYVDLYGGEWAIFAADYVSMGSGFEGDALTADGRIVNGVVSSDHDLGNSYVYSTRDSEDNLVLFAGTERLGSGDSFLELEFNQDHFRLGHGGFGVGSPWSVVGSRLSGDILVRLTFAGGTLEGAEVDAWDGEAWVSMSSIFGEGCDAWETLCAISNAVAVGGGDWAPQPVEAGRFAEVGVNVGALLGGQPDFQTVRLRTPEDAGFGYFAEEN